MGDSNNPGPPSNQADKRNKGFSGPILNENTMFEALAHERRRYLLYTLLEDQAWTLERLATKMAAWEVDTSVADVGEEEVERVYASLYHAHVPKLVDLDIIEFDRQTETITKGANAEQVLRVLELTGGSTAIDLERHARSTEND